MKSLLFVTVLVATVSVVAAARRCGGDAVGVVGAGATIGICYGRVANNLPSPREVVDLLGSRGVTDVKIYDATTDIVHAFANSGITLSVAISNRGVTTMANSQDAANDWVQRYVRPHSHIGSIGVGNEYLSDHGNDASKLVPAMRNVQRALESVGLGHIKVSTPYAFGLISRSYPPSAGEFADNVKSVTREVLEFVQEKNSVFMVNIYPFFSYKNNPHEISLDYALFNPNAPTVWDSGRQYRNLFDAQVDAVYAAMDRLGYGDTKLMITESGWPSNGGATGANNDNARTYNNNLVKHVLRNGTPRRPNDRIKTFIFALFNENEKHGEPEERNFGLYYPDRRPVYHIDLSVSSSSAADRNVTVSVTGDRPADANFRSQAVE